MMGMSKDVLGTFKVFLMLTAGLGLAGCDENGNFAFPTSDGASQSQNVVPPSSSAPATTGEDVQRPDLFEVSDRGLWDGRPSLGGAWVAHPDVTDPERVLIRNVATGEEMTGALFRRERENPGPLLQVSSDVAQQLDILPGAPTDLYVVALRRAEVEEPEEEEVAPPAPVVAELETPEEVEATPLDPIAGGAAAAIEAAEAAAPEVDLPSAEPVVAPAAAAAGTAIAAGAGVATAALDAATPDDLAEQEVIEAEPIEPAVDLTVLPADLDGPVFQVGVYSVEANAIAAAAQLQAAEVPASVLPEDAGGRTVWRVSASPADGERDATLTQIKDLGFVDAVLITDDS